MIAIKLIVQSLAAVAVTGGVVGGAAYKITNDINSETLKNTLSTKIEEQKILSKDFDKNALDLAETIKEIERKNTELETLNSQLLTLQNTQKELRSKIIKLESQISIISNEIYNTETFVFNALRKTENAEKILKKAKDELTAQNVLVAAAKTKVTEEIKAVAIKQTAKNAADAEQKQAKQQETTDATALSELKSKLITEKAAYTEAQRLHSEENSKPALPTCNTESSDSEDQEATKCPANKEQ